MKSKKHLGFVSAVLGACLAVTSFTAVSAFADGSTYAVKSGNVDRAGHYVNTIDYFTLNNEDVAFNKEKFTDLKVYASSDTTKANPLTKDTDYIYDADKGTIAYATAGDYVLDFTIEGNVYSVDVKVVDKATLSVVTDSAKVSDYVTKIESALNSLEDKTSLDLPDGIWDFVESDVYTVKDNGQMLVKVYLAASGGSFSAVNSSFKAEMPDLNLSSSGTYEFYFEVKDPDGNEILKKSDYVQKVDGWYEVDDNGTPDDETDDTETLILPIFKFNYTKVNKLEVEKPTGGGENGVKGIVGQQYTSIKFTSNGTSNDIKLYYSADNKTWNEATEKDATFGSFTVNSTSFTPLKKGYFKFVLQAKGGADGFETTTVESNVIIVNREIQQQKLVNVKFRNFMKNNWLSVVFLGIAFLCVVGIIVLALYKPSEQPKAKKEDKVEDDVVEANTTEDEEVVEVAEDVETEDEEVAEEVTDENEETVETEETTEEATVEVTEDATEEPAVETEEVKTEGEDA